MWDCPTTHADRKQSRTPHALRREIGDRRAHGKVMTSNKWRAYQRSYTHLGNDPAIGSLLVEAGAVPVRNTLVFFGSCTGHPQFSSYVDNLIGVIISARATIVESGLLDSTAFDSAMAELQTWSHGATATMWYAISWAEGHKREDAPPPARASGGPPV
jgi:hypothetical protein